MIYSSRVRVNAATVPLVFSRSRSLLGTIRISPSRVCALSLYLSSFDAVGLSVLSSPPPVSLFFFFFFGILSHHLLLL